MIPPYVQLTNAGDKQAHLAIHSIGISEMKLHPVSRGWLTKLLWPLLRIGTEVTVEYLIPVKNNGEVRNGA